MCVAIHPSIWGPKSTPRRGARSRFSFNLYFAPAHLGTFFGMGMGMSERPLHRRLVFSFCPGGSAPVRTCKLQSSVMAEIRNGEGETLGVEPPSDYLRRRHTTYTQRRPFLHTLHTCSRGGMAKRRWASHSLQTRNCATGREQIPSETAGTLLLLTAPAWKRLLPTNLQTMKCSTGPREREG